MGTVQSLNGNKTSLISSNKNKQLYTILNLKVGIYQKLIFPFIQSRGAESVCFPPLPIWLTVYNEN